MPKVVSVCFKGNFRNYYFESIPNLIKGDYCVVETVRGIELGHITHEEMEIADSEVIGELKKVIRKATPKDLEDYKKNQEDKEECNKKIKEAIIKSGLDMKFLDSEYVLDRSKLLVYFSAEGRIDFRDLVKDLASLFRTRIELRQVGPRDESRMISGIGICGRKCCCSKFLGDISNVTIKMAKNQNLSLNPTSISGLCGKLLCCIAFEDKVYLMEKKRLPDVDEEIETEKGIAKVTDVNIVDRAVTVKYPDGSIDVISYKIEEPKEETKEETNKK